MEPLKTYRGTLYRGHLVTDVPLPDESPVEVLITLVQSKSHQESQEGILPATQSFDLDDEVSLELRRLLSKLPGSLSDDIIAERRGDEQ